MEKEVLEILNKLENNHFEAYIVGGYVRDYILNRETNDIDIATNARPDDIIKIFNDKKMLVNKRFGNVVIDDVEITTFRKDEYNDSRFPKITYVKTVNEDSKRRDFTINALYMNKNYEIIDCCHGMEDLTNKIIKTIKDPSISFNEDPLRIIRAIRFAKILNFEIEKETLLDLKNYAYKLQEISKERINKEIKKGIPYGVLEKEYDFVLKK